MKRESFMARPRMNPDHKVISKTFRLSAEEIKLLERLSNELNTTRTDVIRRGIRKLAKSKAA